MAKSNNEHWEQWRSQKRRCTEKTHTAYPNYGGRGIKFAEEFMDFNIWLDYIKSVEGYTPDWKQKNLSLDRIDNDGNYERGNLKWVTPTEQQLNTRLSKYNKTGYTGISLAPKEYKRKYVVWLYYRGKSNYVGSSDSLKEAVDMRNSYILNNSLPHPIQEYKETK
jgi:hypothetical protein